MSRKYRRLKRILGVSTILLALLIANLPTISFAETPSDSGVDGEIEWNITGDTLTLSAVAGTQGRMKDYSINGDAPWMQSSSVGNIKNIVISSGVTKLGKYSLYGNYTADKLTIAGTVTTVTSECAWVAHINEVEFLDGVTTIEDNAFLNCEIYTVRFPQSINDIAIGAFITVADGCSQHITDVYGYSGGAAEQYATKINQIDRNSYTDEMGYFSAPIITFHSLDGGGSSTADDSGVDGEIEWNITGDTLTLSAVAGTQGRMKDYDSSAPWILSSSIGNVKNIVISDGVTKLGKYPFAKLDGVSIGSIINADKLTIAGTVKTIPADFGMYANVKEVEFNEGVETIEEIAFFMSMPHIIRFPQSIKSVSPYNFYEVADGNLYHIADVYGYSGTAAENFVKSINDAVTAGEFPEGAFAANYGNGDVSGDGKVMITFHPLDSGSTTTPTLTVTDDRNDKENTNCISATVTNLNEDLFLSVKDSAGVTMNSLITLSNGMSLKAYDLTLVNAAGNAVSDFGSCTITLPIPSSMNVSNGTVQAMAVKADGTLERFNTEIIDVNGVKCARFTTTHFSEYALVYTPNADNGGGNTGGDTGNGGDDDNGSNNGGGTGNNGDSGNNGGSGNNGNTNTTNDNSGNSNAGTQGNTDNTANQTTATSTNPDPVTQTRAAVNNANDMPKTGEGDEIRMLIVVSLFLFGCIEIISSISIKKKVKVRVRK